MVDGWAPALITLRPHIGSFDSVCSYITRTLYAAFHGLSFCATHRIQSLISHPASSPSSPHHSRSSATMVSKVFSLTSLLVAAASLVGASPAAPATLQSRQSCVEGKNKICYGVDGGTSQKIDPEELQYLASYLRFVGQSNSGMSAFYQMPTAATCQEWSLTLPEGATILILAKHIAPFVKSAVLYADIANTIDGGEGATDAQRQAALLGCAQNGGQMGVAVNTSNPAYTSAEFKDTRPGRMVLLSRLSRNPRPMSIGTSPRDAPAMFKSRFRAEHGLGRSISNIGMTCHHVWKTFEGGVEPRGAVCLPYWA